MLRLATGAMLVLLSAAVLAACGGDDENSPAPAANAAATATTRSAGADAGRTFVGKVDGTDANIAIAVGDGAANAYVCDSKKIWGFVTGSNQDGKLTLANNRGDTLEATVDGDAVSGTVKLEDGTEHAFTATPAKGDGGLYELARNVDGTAFVTRWVRTNDGEVRGKPTVAVTGAAAGAAAVNQATAGAGASEVPPAAEPTPAPAGFVDKVRCNSTIRKHNRLATTINGQGGTSQATNQQLDDIMILRIEIDLVCGRGSSEGPGVTQTPLVTS
jgi:hypothetical protein